MKNVRKMTSNCFNEEIHGYAEGLWFPALDLPLLCTIPLGLLWRVAHMGRTLYNSTSNFVSYSGYIFYYFAISCGIHHCCPFPPLLFTLALEPLAIQTHLNTNIREVKIALVQHKLQLFANDFLLVLTSKAFNPLSTSAIYVGWVCTKAILHRLRR